MSLHCHSRRLLLFLVLAAADASSHPTHTRCSTNYMQTTSCKNKERAYLGIMKMYVEKYKSGKPVRCWCQLY